MAKLRKTQGRFSENPRELTRQVQEFERSVQESLATANLFFVGELSSNTVGSNAIIRVRRKAGDAAIKVESDRVILPPPGWYQVSLFVAVKRESGAGNNLLLGAQLKVNDAIELTVGSRPVNTIPTSNEYPATGSMLVAIPEKSQVTVVTALSGGTTVSVSQGGNWPSRISMVKVRDL